MQITTHWTARILLRQKSSLTSLLTSLICLSFNLHVSAASTNVWNGASTSDANWSDAANWGGNAMASGNAVTFAGSARIANTNDLSGLSLGAVTLTNSAWNIQGDAVTLTSGTFLADFSGTCTWGLPTTLGATPSFVQNATGDSLNLTGVLSGTGGITKTAGSTGQGVVYLSNTNNSFTGAVTVSSGTLIYYSLAPGGTNSSLGAGTGVITVGATSTSYAGTLTFAGANGGYTDRGLNFKNLTTSTTTLNNNSTNNSGLTFNGLVTFADGTSGDIFTTAFGGTSAATNVFNGAIGADVTPYWGGNLQVSGPGTWVFNNSINTTGGFTVATNSHLVFGFTNNVYISMPLCSAISVSSGGTMDVSAFDSNSAAFTLGINSGYPQVLTAGRTKGALATDINGSVSMNNGGAASATLNVAGTGTAGTLTINGNFTPGDGTIALDLNTNTAIGLYTNDLIAVNGNLDLSQGTATINISALHGATSILPNTPYTIIVYNGTLTGDASGLTVPAPSYAYQAGVVDTSVPGLVTVSFAPSGVAAATLIWQGNVNNNWDVDTTENWLSGGNPAYFNTGNNVVFNDSSSQTAINLASTISAGNVVVSNNASSYTFSGNSLAADNILKQGPGTLTLASANSYSDGTVISAGIVQVNNGTGLGSGSVTLDDTNTGSASPQLAVGAGVVIANAITVSSSGAGTPTIATSSGSATLNGAIVMQRGFTFTNESTTQNNFLIQGGISGTGDVTVEGGGGVKLQTGACSFNGNIYILPGTSGTTLCNINAALSTNTSINVAAGTQLGIVNSAPFNALNGSGAVIDGPGATYVSTVILGSGNGSGTFSGIITTNSGGFAPGLTKNGTGTEILTGDFTGASTGAGLNTGNTTINAGTLLIDNATGTGLNPCGVTVNAAGTLGGSGSINENTNGVGVYGTLSVGNPGDVSGTNFTIAGAGTGGSLTIHTNGILSVNLFNGAGAGDNTGNAAAADYLNAQCPVILAAGAVLKVGNPENLTAWAAGDKWKIASWSSAPSGTFTVTNLPALPTGLAWDTSTLYTSGVIDIISSAGPTAPADITGITVSGGNLIITGTNLNGGASFHYEVLTATNLSVPLTNWTVLSTNSFNANGTFSCTNAVSPTNPAVFFDVKAVQ